MNVRLRLVWLAVLCALAVWCWVDIWPRGTLDPAKPELHRTDFTVYTTAGKAALSGIDPYTVTNARGWGYLYLPLFALLVSPLAALPEGWQCVIWFWLSVAFLWGAGQEFARLDAWLFPRAHAKDAPLVEPFVGGAVFRALCFALPVLNCLQRGQVGILQFHLTLLGTRWVLTSPSRLTRWCGGLVLAGAVVLKLSPALPALVLLGGVLLGRDRLLGSQRSSFGRALGPTCGFAAGIILGVWLLPAAILGWQANQNYLQTWRTEILSKANSLSDDPFAGDSHSSKNQSPMNAVWLLGNSLMREQSLASGGHPMDGDVGQWIIWITRVGAVLLTLISVLLLFCQKENGAALIAVALANAATLLVTPVARGHYFMALLPATIWLPEWLARQMAKSGPVSLLVPMLGWLPPLLLLLHYLTGSFLANFGVLGLGSLLWLVLATAAIVEIAIHDPSVPNHY